MGRTLLFDMAEVLVVGLNGVERPIGAHCGVDPETVLPALSGAWFSELAAGHTADIPLPPETIVRRDWFYDLMCGRIDEDLYWAEVIRREGWHAEIADLKRIMREHFHTPIAGMPEMLIRLAVDYDLVLLSDHAREWIVYVEQFHRWLEIIPTRFYSFDIGAMKREAASFEYVLRKLEIEPGDVLFIDDNARNIAVAAGLGIDGIRFENAAQLKSALPSHGVVLN